MLQDAFGRNEGHVPMEDEDSLMQNSTVKVALRYLLQGWSRDTDLESERAWRRDRPLFMSTPSTEQGQCLYCYSLVIPSQIKAGSCFKPEYTEKVPSEMDGDFPLFSHTLCEKDRPVAIPHSSAFAYASLQRARSAAPPSCIAKAWARCPKRWQLGRGKGVGFQCTDPDTIPLQPAEIRAKLLG